MNFYLLTIASFRIGAPSILFFSVSYNWRLIVLDAKCIVELREYYVVQSNDWKYHNVVKVFIKLHTYPFFKRVP
jgi:hypothetical protein